jgi:hypothetical protein
VKALSIGLSVLALLVFHRCARRLLGDRAGLLATALFAASSFQVYYAQEVRPYALISLVTVAQLWGYSLVRFGPSAETRPSAWRLGAFAAINAVAVFTSLFQAFLLAALSLADLLATALLSGGRGRIVALARSLDPLRDRHRSRDGVLPPARARGLGDGGAARIRESRRGPALLRLRAALRHHSRSAGDRASRRTPGRRSPGELAPPRPRRPRGRRPDLGLCAEMSPSRRRETESGHETAAVVLTLATALGFVLLLLFAWVTGVQWLPRHSAFSSPLLALVAGSCLAEPIFSSCRRGSLLGGAVLACLLLANLWSLDRYYFDDRYRKDDYRGIGRLLADDPGTPALMVWGNVELVRRYGGASAWGFRDLPPSRTVEELRARVDPGEEAYLLVNRPYYWSDRPIEELVPGYRVVERIDRPGFHVYRLRSPALPHSE